MHAEIDLQTQLSHLADFGATWVMWLLLGLSMVCLTVVLERALYFWRSRANLGTLHTLLHDALHTDAEHPPLMDARSQEAQVLSAGLGASRQGHDVVERLASATQFARLDMEQRLAVLGTIGNNAPFVGLLGTVIGIIGAFRELDQAAGQVTAGLMAQIGEALIATAMGLVVALPAVGFFNLFNRLVRTREARAQALGRELLSRLDGARTGAQPAE